MFLIAVTGWGQKEDKARANSAGFDYHLTKPMDLDHIEKLLQGGFQHRDRAVTAG
jgi:CheY-like chemotaxis protein